MAARKKKVGAQFLAHYVFNLRPGRKTPQIEDVFVLAEDMEQLNGMIERDTYDLRKRGFALAGTYRLSQLGAGEKQERLPSSGAYETAQSIYLEGATDE